MTAGRLSRRQGDGRPEPPVRLLHLGLGNFFRAHQAWYTDRSEDAAEWGFAAFAGRSAGTASQLQGQDGLYTLITRHRAGDRLEVISSLSRAHSASDTEAWLAYFAHPGVAAVTITITEAGYRRAPAGRLDTADPAVKADIRRLRESPEGGMETAIGRMVAGLSTRRRAGGAPLAVVPCDNVPGNAQMARTVMLDMATRVDRGLALWIEESVDFVGTVVDRITPRCLPSDLRLVEERTGRADAAPVVTEPFSEWVLSGRFPQGRPGWEPAGATFTHDLEPFERRKLWLLNGAHSLLAYAGAARGHETVFEAVRDEVCREWIEQWWAEAARHLAQSRTVVEMYLAELLERFANPRMNDRLARIAEDGSQKLPIRVVPVLLAEREAGRLPIGAATVVAGWLCHLRGSGPPVQDARAAEVVPLAAGALGPAIGRVLGWLEPSLAEDRLLARLVEDRARMLAGPNAGGR